MFEESIISFHEALEMVERVEGGCTSEDTQVDIRTEEGITQADKGFVTHKGMLYRLANNTLHTHTNPLHAIQDSEASWCG